MAHARLVVVAELICEHQVRYQSWINLTWSDNSRGWERSSGDAGEVDDVPASSAWDQIGKDGNRIHDCEGGIDMNCFVRWDVFIPSLRKPIIKTACISS